MSTLTLTLLLAVAGLILVVTAIWTIVLGFKRHWAWGLGLLVSTLTVWGICWAAWVLPVETARHYLVVWAIFLVLGAAVYFGFLRYAWEEAQQPLYWRLALFPILLVAALSIPAATGLPSVAAALRGKGVPEAFLVRWHLVPAASQSIPDAPAPREERPVAVPPAERIPPATVFRSKIPPSRVAAGQREPAAPGTFYLLERVTTQTATGIHAANVGEKVTLLERLPGNKLRVAQGLADFVVRSSQVTDDLTVAREVEKQDFLARGGQL